MFTFHCQTGNLTTGVDGLDKFTGGLGNDTFVALIDNTITATSAQPASTFTALDSIDGGAGNDTLTLNAITAVTALPSATVANIETVNIKAAAAFVADVSAFTGLTNANVTQAAGDLNITAAATTAVDVKGAADNVTIIGGSTQTVTTNLTDGKTITLTKGTDVTVTTTKVGTGNIVIGTNAATTADHATGKVTIQSTGDSFADAATGALGAITVNGGTIVNINQDAYGAGAITGTTQKTVTQSAITVNGDANTTSVTVTQDAATAGTTTAVKTGNVTESASVTFSIMKSGQTLSTAGLTFTATKDLTAAEVATAFSNLAATTFSGTTANDTMGSGISANGFYSGSLAGYTSSAAAGSTVVFTSTSKDTPVTDLSFVGTAQTAPVTGQVVPVVTVTQGSAGTTVNNIKTAAVVNGAVAIDAGTADKITTVTLDAYGAASTVASEALSTLNLANSAQGITVTNTTAASTLALGLNKVTGTVDLDGSAGKYTTLNITSSGAKSTTALTAAGVKTLTVAGDQLVTLSNDLTALEKVTVTGTAGLNIAASAASTLVSVDTTATTGTVTSVLDTATTYAGGAGMDIVTVAANNTKALTLGAGNDTATMLTAVGTGGSVDAGEGMDTLSITATLANTLSADPAFEAGISNFEVLSIGAATAATAVKLDNMDDMNSVTTAGTSGVGALTITKYGANGTLTINGALTGATSSATLATATGTADVFNIAINATTADINNTASLVVADVETINIASNDTQLDDNSDTVIDSTNDIVESNTLNLAATSATKIVATGNANLTLTTDTTNVKIVEIDASEMTGRFTATTTNTTAAQTIKGGSASDTLTSTGNFANVLLGGAGNDTLTAGAGLDTLTGGTGSDKFVISTASLNSSSYATITDFNMAEGDVIEFTGANKFAASAVTLGTTAVFQDYVNAAMNASALNELSWFQYAGNTYIVMDAVSNSTTFVNGTDKIVKVSGLVDLSQMAFSNTTGGLNGTVAATLLTTMDAASATAVDASGVTGITGTAAEVQAAYTANTATTITGLGNEVVTISDTTATLAVLKALEAATTGLVTATTVTSTSGSVSDATLLLITNEATTGDKIDMNAAVVVSLTDATTTFAAEDLSAVGNATTGTVTLANSQTLQGTKAQVTGALVTDATKVVMAATKTATVDLDGAESFTAVDLTALYGTITDTTVVGTATDTITVTALNGKTVSATESIDTFSFAQNDVGVTINSFTSAKDFLNLNAMLVHSQGADSAATLLTSAAAGKLSLAKAELATGQTTTTTNGVVAITDQAAADWSDVAAIIAAGVTVDGTAANNGVFTLLVDNGTDTRIYNYTDVNNGFLAADDITLVGTVSTKQVDGFVAADFITA